MLGVGSIITKLKPPLRSLETRFGTGRNEAKLSGASSVGDGENPEKSRLWGPGNCALLRPPSPHFCSSHAVANDGERCEET